jgi:hypothetical protein
MGCGDCEKEDQRVKEEVAREGWAEAAGWTPSTPLLSQIREGFI